MFCGSVGAHLKKGFGSPNTVLLELQWSTPFGAAPAGAAELEPHRAGPKNQLQKRTNYFSHNET